jgi:hypothetical protein
MTEPKKYAISRKEVTEIIIGLLDDKIETKEAIDKICSLAIPEDNKLMRKIKRLEANEEIYHRRLKELEDKSEVVAEGEVTYDEDEGDFWIGGTGNFYTIKDDIGEKLIKLVGKKVRIKVEVTDD